MSLINQNHIDLVCLNHKDFYSCCPSIIKHIKTARPTIKVILVINQDAKIIMDYLTNGVDEFIIRNAFTKEGLLCRLNKLLSYYNYPILQILEYKDVSLNRYSRELFFRGNRVLLTENEVLVMEFIIRNQGRCLSKQLISYISLQSSQEYSQKALVMTISRLRKRIYKQTGYTLIKTTYGSGYYLNL